MSDPHLDVVLKVLNAALEHTPKETRDILMTAVQGPINELAKKLAPPTKSDTPKK